MIILLNCYFLLCVLYDVLLCYQLHFNIIFFLDGLSHFQVDLLLKTLLLESLNWRFCCMIKFFVPFVFFNFYRHYLLVSNTLLVSIRQTLSLFFPPSSFFIYVIAFLFFTFLLCLIQNLKYQFFFNIFCNAYVNIFFYVDYKATCIHVT